MDTASNTDHYRSRSEASISKYPKGPVRIPHTIYYSVTISFITFTYNNTHSSSTERDSSSIGVYNLDFSAEEAIF